MKDSWLHKAYILNRRRKEKKRIKQINGHAWFLQQLSISKKSELRLTKDGMVVAFRKDFPAMHMGARSGQVWVVWKERHAKEQERGQTPRAWVCLAVQLAERSVFLDPKERKMEWGGATNWGSSCCKRQQAVPSSKAVWIFIERQWETIRMLSKDVSGFVLFYGSFLSLYLVDDKQEWNFGEEDYAAVF